MKLSDSMADLAAKKVDWWRQNEDNLPFWAGAVKMVLNPSSLPLRLLGELSAYSESPFQISTEQAALETSVMLHYNHRRDNNVDVFELTT